MYLLQNCSKEFDLDCLNTVIQELIKNGICIDIFKFLTPLALEPVSDFMPQFMGIKYKPSKLAFAKELKRVVSDHNYFAIAILTETIQTIPLAMLLYVKKLEHALKRIKAGLDFDIDLHIYALMPKATLQSLIEAEAVNDTMLIDILQSVNDKFSQLKLLDDELDELLITL